MSVQEAMTSAIREVLGAYLAPELTEQLTEDIVQRAAPDLEAALLAFVGFELGGTKNAKGAVGRTGTRGNKNSRNAARKRLTEVDATAQDSRSESDDDLEDASIEETAQHAAVADSGEDDPMTMPQ